MHYLNQNLKIGCDCMKLRKYQKEAIEAIIKNDRGLLIMPTGSGKSIALLGIYEAIKPQKCLLIVTNNALKIQMQNTFIEHKNINIITWQSLMYDFKNSSLITDYDLVLCDEFHNSGEETFYFKILQEINPRKLYACTATLYRHDSIEPLKELCANHICEIDIENLYKENYLIRPYINFINTNISFDVEKNLNSWEKKNTTNEMLIGKLKKELGTNQKRNNFIINFIENNLRKNNIVLSYTTEQTEFLYYSFKGKIEKHLIHGKLSKNEKELFFQEMEKKNDCIIFATQSFLGEGIDIPKLDTLFLTTPLGSKAKPIQFIGRILRPCDGKKNTLVYDFVDNIFGIGSQWKHTRKKQYDTLKPVYNVDLNTEKQNAQNEYNELLKRLENAEKYFQENKNPNLFFLEILSQILEKIKFLDSQYHFTK